MPELKKNLIGVTHICDELHGAKVIFTATEFYVNAPDLAILYGGNRVNGLYKMLNLAWLGVMEVQRAGSVYTDTTMARQIQNYCEGAAMIAAEVDAELRCTRKSS